MADDSAPTSLTASNEVSAVLGQGVQLKNTATSVSYAAEQGPYTARHE